MKITKTSAVLIAGACISLSMAEEPRGIGSTRHLWVDNTLVDTMGSGMTFQLHHPRVEGPYQTQPSGYYMTILREESGLLRAYYRGYLPDTKIFDEYTAYAESTDGINWIKPNLDIIKFEGNEALKIPELHDDDIRNAVFWKTPEIRFEGLAHNFAPFIDYSPNCPPEEKYKAVAGTPALGLWSFTSPDGIHWNFLPHYVLHPYSPQKFPDGSKITRFDSHNVAFYNILTGKYELYYRFNCLPDGRSARSVCTVSVDDFKQADWPEGEFCGPNFPGEDLYTLIPNQYFRAPDYLLCFPTRYIASRGSATDIMFITKWRDNKFERLHREAIIRPGNLKEAWGNRRNYIARGLFPVGEREVACYENLNKRRYVWRLDGFSSLHAGAEPASVMTKPFVFEGSQLTINAETSAAGYIRIEFLTGCGNPIPDYPNAVMEEYAGDGIDVPLTWKCEKALSELAGKPVRMRITMSEADFYSFKFE